MAGGMSALRGRGQEREALDRALDAVRGGESSVLLIHGEAGIGKTALLRYCARSAAGCRVAQIAGVESEMELPFAALHQLCAPMIENLSTLPEPQEHALRVAFGLVSGSPPDRFVVGLAILGVLAEVAAKQPLVCLIDDAQWLDEASSQVLGFVARRLLAESVLLVLAARETEGRLFSDLPDLPVGGLADEDARELLATTVAGRLDDQVRDRIVAETGGNPLALLELPRGMSSAELAGGFGLPEGGGLPAQIQERYAGRIRDLPVATQRLMLLAAADSVGDPTVVWRAATALGIGMDAATPAASALLLEIGARVRFHHPLVRSAVYRSAADEERRAAHSALAEATDPDTDPDRRAWHRAHAAVGPDPDVAADLDRSAGRAQARGGLAAAAALLEWSANLTPEPAPRVERRLAAALFNLQAGAFEATLTLLAEAESEATDEFARARIELLRGLVASASRSSGEAPLQLLRAAKRLEPLDAALARQTYLDAWGAALFAGHLASPGGDVVSVSRAARAAPRPGQPMGPFDEILDGLSAQITDGHTEAAPILARAVRALLEGEIAAEEWLRWGILASSAAVTLWDFESWRATSTHHVELARESGALAMLSIALNGQAMIAVWAGDFVSAGSLVAEDDAIKLATGSQIAPYGAMLFAAYLGRSEEASALIAKTIEDSVARGEGLGVDLARWTAAILHNGAGQYQEALRMARPAKPETPGLYISTWMLPERIEAAIRCGQIDAAAAALEEFVASANPGDSPWGKGVEARCRALLAEGAEADGLYRKALDRLSRANVLPELARSHLLYGEWLRRENRRVDARAQLRTAYDMFSAMGADGFAERARAELLATGETVRKRQVDTLNELTPQEEHIARLARDGRTNAEIATELFLSARTVEWHLRKVFTKLGITSRKGLRDALPASRRSAASD